MSCTGDFGAMASLSSFWALGTSNWKEWQVLHLTCGWWLYGLKPFSFCPLHVFPHFSAAFCTAHCALDLARDHMRQKCPLLLLHVTKNQPVLITLHTHCTWYHGLKTHVLRITTLKPDSIYNTHNILKYFSQLQISEFMLISRNSYYWLGVAMFLLPVVSENVGQFLLFVTLVICHLVTCVELLLQ